MGRVFASALGAALTFSILLPASVSRAAEAELGRPLPRITNGVSTGDRPTTGALLARSGSNYAQICTGTLIGCETFLTAAHCVCSGTTFATCGTPSPSQHAVYLQNAGIFGVAGISVHTGYQFGVAGDVAVVRLSTPVTGIAPTPINTTGTPAFGTEAAIAGFGITSGGAADNGLLRQGLVEIASCAGEVPQGAHVCWTFESPLGVAGSHSNTCNGDSGGPLFADIAGVETVVGITSGGVSDTCLPSDVSFDADVFVYRTFIESIGGSDLANTSCGGIAQVGEPGVTETAIDFSFFVKAEVACRKEIAKQYDRYVGRRLLLEQRCIDDIGDGDGEGPCPDAWTAARLAVLAARIDADKIAARCPEHVIGRIGVQSTCAGAVDAGDLAACILAAGDAAVAAMLDVEYAEPEPAAEIGDDAERACQEGVASAMTNFVRSSLRARTKCQAQRGQQKVSSCPDANAQAVLLEAEGEAAAEIVAACDDVSVASLDASGGFGGSCAGASDAATLADCQINEHEAVVQGLVDLLEDPAAPTAATVEVPPGTVALRVTLNGRQGSLNDLDVYLKLGSAPTTSSYDYRSINGGMFEKIEVASPAAGTWHILIDRYSGNLTIPYQLTATVY